MGMKCPACGGQLLYNSDKDKMICEFCDSIFDPEEYKENNTADFTMNMFICKGCGAQLDAPEEQTVAYCAYCGNEAVLEGKYTPQNIPRRIIPFSISKEEAIKSYTKEINSKAFVPKEFKDATLLKGFRGIYLPYWNYDVEVENSTKIVKGTKDYSSGNYDYHEEYDVTVEIGGKVKSPIYDASAEFDDTIAANIAPFNINEDKEFNSSYLAGFYVDKATTSSDVYTDIVKDEVVKNVWSDVESKADSVKISNAERNKDGGVELTCDNAWISLFPVWFLTWKKSDRVAYSVMNGQTGKLSMEIPVDKKKFFTSVGIVSLIAFVIISLIPIFILPIKLASIASLIMLFVAILLKGELKNINDKESHKYDLGFKDEKGVVGDSSVTIGGILSFIAFCIAIYFSLFEIDTSIELGKFLFAATIFQLILSISEMNIIKNISLKIAMVPAIYNVVVLVAGGCISIKRLPQDYWYYAITIACFLGMMIMCICTMYYIDYLVTRPVPNFYTRQGANNGYKN